MQDDFYLDDEALDEDDDLESYEDLLNEAEVEELLHICTKIRECAYGYYEGRWSFCQYCLLTGELRNEPAALCSKFKPRDKESIDENREILY